MTTSTAVTADGVDAGLAWHYGDPLGEQRALVTTAGVIDRSNRGVLIVPGADRLSWLHSIISQHVATLADGQSTEALVLSPNGHVEQHWQLTELDGTVWIDVDPGQAEGVLAYLTKMRFLMRVEPADVSADWGVLSVLGPRSAEVLAAAGLPVADGDRAVALPDGGLLRPRPDGGFDLIVATAAVQRTFDSIVAAGARPTGTWALEAIRVADRRPRLGLETDHRTIPHEVGWIGVAVHLDKGCYRGQETVARVQNLGRPPRRLVLLHLSGETDSLPEAGTPVELDGRQVGFLGTAVQHYELGPIALAVIKRSIPDDAALTVAGEPVSLA